MNSFKDRLACFQWNTDHDDVNLMTNAFMDKFDNLYRECFPIKIKHVGTKRFKKPWITNSIFKSINNKHNLSKLVKLSLCSKEYFNKYRNTLTLLIRNCRKHYFIDKFNHVCNDIKSTWKLINNVISRKMQTNKNINLKINNQIAGDSDVSLTFNKFFTDNPKTLHKRIPSSLNDPDPINFKSRSAKN